MAGGKKRFCQIVHTLSYGDAISSEVLALQRCLSELDFESEVFAINVHPKLKGQAKDYRELKESFDGEVILHYSLGSPLNGLYSSVSRAKRSLIYHNLTPPRWFYGVNPRIVKDIEHGLVELPALCRLSDRLISDSKFNASELKSHGFDSLVLDLPIDPARWDVAANQGILDIVRSEPGIHLLHVGRLAPNKCVEDIIKSFYFLHHYINKRSRLWLVGIDIDTELYSFSLKKLALDLGLEHAINFVGCMADSEVRALYESASVYVCMSEHEGFCLPVVEAMSFGLPVIAFASSAIPETIGSGGVLVSEKRHPEIAELINRVVTDNALKQEIVAAGKNRVQQLSYARFKEQVAQVFATQDNDRASNLQC